MFLLATSCTQISRGKEPYACPPPPAGTVSNPGDYERCPKKNFNVAKTAELLVTTGEGMLALSLYVFPHESCLCEGL